MTRDRNLVPCPVCGLACSPSELVEGQSVRPPIVELIRTDHPDWSVDGSICYADLNRYRIAHLEAMLDAERGELTELDRDVLAHIRAGEALSEDVVANLEHSLTLGDRISDRIAELGGSWTFLLGFFAVLAAWIFANTVLLVRRPFDPFPFILLNLALSCVAAVQAPVIMMSQRRQESKDRARSEHDFEVNLKAELEVRLLHEKVDHLILHQWQRLLDIQQMQTEMLQELTQNRIGRSRPKA